MDSIKDAIDGYDERPSYGSDAFPRLGDRRVSRKARILQLRIVDIDRRLALLR